MENKMKLNPLLENLLKDKVIAVTGAGSGLGRAISLGLVFSGAKIGLIDINKEAIDSLEKEINTKEEVSIALQASVTSQEELEKVYNKLIEKFGSIDGLVNCAGIARLGTIDSLTEKDVKLSNDININGYFLNTNIASKKMIELGKKGAIINISSASARGASKGSSLYGVAKEAQCSMVRSFALDLGENGIRVNALLLGDLFGDEELGISSAIWNKTYFEKKAIDKGLIQKDDPRLQEEKLNSEVRAMVVNHYVSRTALQKQIIYQDVINQIILLNSDLCSKITGESISITSGNPSAFSR